MHVLHLRPRTHGHCVVWRQHLLAGGDGVVDNLVALTGDLWLEVEVDELDIISPASKP